MQPLAEMCYALWIQPAFLYSIGNVSEGTILISIHQMHMPMKVRRVLFFWNSVAPPRVAAKPAKPPIGKVLVPKMSWHGDRRTILSARTLQFGQYGQARRPNNHGSLNFTSYMYAATTARGSRAVNFLRVWYKGNCSVTTSLAASVIAGTSRPLICRKASSSCAAPRSMGS